LAIFLIPDELFAIFLSIIDETIKKIITVNKDEVKMAVIAITTPIANPGTKKNRANKNAKILSHIFI
jgi:hypothetical protein